MQDKCTCEYTEWRPPVVPPPSIMMKGWREASKERRRVRQFIPLLINTHLGDLYPFFKCWCGTISLFRCYWWSNLFTIHICFVGALLYGYYCCCCCWIGRKRRRRVDYNAIFYRSLNERNGHDDLRERVHLAHMDMVLRLYRESKGRVENPT